MINSKQLILIFLGVIIMYKEYALGTLCNVSLCRPTNQTSHHTAYQPEYTSSCNAVDGDHNSSINGQSCMLTGLSLIAYFHVDLGNTYDIAFINITWRHDNVDAINYASEITIFVGNNLGPDGTLVKESSSLCLWLSGTISTVIDQPQKYSCNSPKSGRYVRIERAPFPESSLSLCEAEIYADVASSDCPHPPSDWFCSDFSPTLSNPRSKCLPNNDESTTGSFTTGNHMTTNFESTTMETSSQITTDMTTSVISTTQTELTTSVMSTTQTELAPSVISTTHTELTTQMTNQITSTGNNQITSTGNGQVTSTEITLTDQNNTCYCPCTGYIVLTPEELEKKIQQIVSELKIDPKETSSSKRKLISASDSRQSAKAVGSVGIVILITFAAFIVLLDMDVIFKSVEKCRARKRRVNITGETGT